MDRRIFTIAAVLAAVLATLAALAPISRAISKISPDLFLVVRQIFLNTSLAALALGLAFVGLAVFLSDRHRLFALILLILAPIAAMLAGMMFPG